MKKIVALFSDIRLRKGLKLPLEIYKNDELKIILNDFPEKKIDEEFFSKIGKESIITSSIFNTFGSSKSIFEICSTKNEIPMIMLLNFDFVFKTITGCAFNFQSKGYSLNGDYQQRPYLSTTTTKEKILTQEKVEEIKLLLPKVDVKFKNNEKQNLLNSLLNICLQDNLQNIRASFWIVLLESLFAPEKEQEIRYRFPLRMTKFFKENMKFKNKMRDYYDLRSKTLHGSTEEKEKKKKGFKKEDLIFLENIATKSIKEFILHPEKFEPDYLDNLLLENA